MKSNQISAHIHLLYNSKTSDINVKSTTLSNPFYFSDPSMLAAKSIELNRIKYPLIFTYFTTLKLII